jgi:hypothetical protein
VGTGEYATDPHVTTIDCYCYCYCYWLLALTLTTAVELPPTLDTTNADTTTGGEGRGAAVGAGPSIRDDEDAKPVVLLRRTEIHVNYLPYILVHHDQMKE